MKNVSTFLCMVLCSIALHANVLTGTCGDNLTWSYDTDTKALTIEGSGAMTDYEYDNQPWAQVQGDILSVFLPDGLTSIGDGAFWECSSIILPNSVTTIGGDAFSGCSSLTSINIPNSVTSIGYGAFWACSSLTSITIPNSVTSIGERAFALCSALTSMVVESGNTVYDSRENCNAIIETATNTLIAGCQSTTIPNSVTSIGGYAFYGCSSLTSITLPNSVTSIGWAAFAGCSSLTSITLPNSVTSVEDYAFCVCSSLTSITLPNSVTRIGDYAFWDCSSLTSITIPNSVTSIGESAFEYCSSLTSITCYAPIPPTCSSNSFDGVPRTIPLYVPAESVEAYQAADTWKEFDVQALLSTDATETASDKGATKLLRDGQVLIIRNGETYDMTGQRL